MAPFNPVLLSVCSLAHRTHPLLMNWTKPFLCTLQSPYSIFFSVSAKASSSPSSLSSSFGSFSPSSCFLKLSPSLKVSKCSLLDPVYGWMPLSVPALGPLTAVCPACRPSHPPLPLPLFPAVPKAQEGTWCFRPIHRKPAQLS